METEDQTKMDPTETPSVEGEGLAVAPCSVQWWVADLDRYGNPTLSDGAHENREGCEQALYIMARLGLRPEQKRAICRVEIYPPESKAHGASEGALNTLNAIGLRPNSDSLSERNTNE